MKKLTLAILFTFSLSAMIQAQDFNKAIGVRGGYGAEISYQFPLSGNTRAEADLGLYGIGNGGFTLTGIHQWVFGIQDGLNWYLGAGPQIGAVNNSFGIGIAGQAGIEYYIPNVPIQLSLDYRPSWFIIPTDYKFAPYGLGIGIRYTF